MQQWKDITGFEKSYQISNDGVVRSKDRQVEYKHGGKPRFWPGKILSQWVGNSGYFEVALKMNDNKFHKMIHRLVATHFIDNPGDFPQVNHKDNNKLNNNADNLEWCDQFYNVQHAFKNSFHSGKGGSHYLAKPVLHIETNRFYPTLKEAAAAAGVSSRVLCSMLKGHVSNRSGMRYV